MKLMIITRKYAVDSVIQFPTKSILRALVFKETIRQCDTVRKKFVFKDNLEFLAKDNFFLKK